mgnify:CR=1 FL=1
MSRLEYSPHRGLIETALPAWLIRASDTLRQHYFASSVVSLRSTREAAAVTFLVAAAGVAPLGVGAAFWGLAAGLVYLGVLRLGARSARPGSAPAHRPE